MKLIAAAMCKLQQLSYSPYSLPSLTMSPHSSSPSSLTMSPHSTSPSSLIMSPHSTSPSPLVLMISLQVGLL